MLLGVLGVLSEIKYKRNCCGSELDSSFHSTWVETNAEYTPSLVREGKYTPQG